MLWFSKYSAFGCVGFPSCLDHKSASLTWDIRCSFLKHGHQTFWKASECRSIAPSVVTICTFTNAGSSKTVASGTQGGSIKFFKVRIYAN